MVKIMKKNEAHPLTIHFFKNKKQMILYIFLFIILLCGFIYFGSKEYPVNNTDNEKFTSEHTGANQDNVFKYINVKEAYNLIRSDDCILFLGIPNNENVTYYANVLDDVAKDMGINNINYYDIADDRKNRNDTYESIVNYFASYITYTDSDMIDLHAPTLIIKKGGEVIFFDDQEAFRKGNISNQDYWATNTADKKFLISNALNVYLEENE